MSLTSKCKYITVALALLMLLTGCGKPKRTEFQQAQINGERKELIQLYNQLASTYAEWEDLYVPVSLALESPMSMSISGRCTMVRGKEIYLSLRFMGIEAAVAYVNADSVYVVDKVHKMYLAEAVPHALGGYDLTISDLQDLLLGQAFAPGQGTVSNDVEVDIFFDENQQGTWGIGAASENPDIDWWCTLSETDPPTLSSLSFAKEDKGQVDCIYTDHADTPAGIVASDIALVASMGEKGVNANVKWNLGSAKWNSGRTVNFKYPKGYKKINAQSLRQALQKF